MQFFSWGTRRISAHPRLIAKEEPTFLQGVHMDAVTFLVKDEAVVPLGQPHQIIERRHIDRGSQRVVHGFTDGDEPGSVPQGDAGGLVIDTAA